MPQACERCWRRKQKVSDLIFCVRIGPLIWVSQCSRETPICLQCRNASATCIRRRFGSTVHDSDNRCETGIEALKSKIQDMKARLQECSYQISPSSSHVATHSGIVGLGSDATASSESPARDQSNTSQEHQSVHEGMQNNVGYLSLSAMAERTDGEPFSTDGLSYLTLLYAATGISGSNPTLSDKDNEFLTGSLTEFRRIDSLNVDLGGPEMRAAYLRYVDMVKMSFPFKSSPALLSAYESITSLSHENNLDGVPPETLALVYVGIATGLLLSSHYTYKEMLSAELAVRAVRLMPQVLGCGSHMPAIHCLTALTIFSMFTAFGGSTWHLLGLLMTRCVSAGIHTFRSANVPPDGAEQTQIRRELWTLYILDT